MSRGPALARLRQFVVHRLLHADDTPHSIALGTAIGMFVAWTPIVGPHIVAVLALAALLRVNKAAALGMVWISNPLTIVPMSLSGYMLGSHLLGGRYSMHEFGRSIQAALSGSGAWWEHVRQWWDVITPVLVPLWAGCLLVGLVTAVLSYVLVFYGVTAFRRRRELHRLRHSPLPQARPEAPLAPPPP